MVFSSYIFLCFFLPIVFILHSVFKNNTVRNALLILASLVFYAYGEPVYVILLIVSVCINYFFGLLIDRSKSSAPLIIAVLINIGSLVFFKYTMLITETVNAAFGLNLVSPSITLPIGISFYTFQALSYLIDVRRGQVQVQRNFFSLLLYISFFPQLIAGPIVKYHDVNTQINSRVCTLEKTRNGIIRFTAGLSKKILISNVMAYVADTIFAFDKEQIGVTAAWIGAVAYLMQIYFDFSGYSDMAIGLGKMFGFDFAENFNYPYMSDSVQEFWRRWHISLSTWFKEYLYIPLGGNRKGRLRTYINKYIVFAATGIWHGANWTFLFWGLFHGTFLVLESSGAVPIKKCKVKFIKVIYTMLIVTVGFVMFRADTISQGLYMIGSMFGMGMANATDILYVSEFLSPYYIIVAVAAMIGCTDIPKKLLSKLAHNRQYVYMILALCGLVLCYMSLASESYNPFIYFRF